MLSGYAKNWGTRSILQQSGGLIADAPEKTQQEFLLNIKKEVRHMEWLVTALLKMANLDSSAADFKKEKISVDSLLQEALKSLEIILDIRN